MNWKDEEWLKNGYWITLTREQFEEWVNLNWPDAVEMVGGIVDFVFQYDDNVYCIEEVTPRKQKNVERQIEVSKRSEGDFKPIYTGNNYKDVLQYPCFDGKSFNQIFEQLLFLS